MSNCRSGLSRTALAVPSYRVRGALATDPASLVRAYFTTPETVSTSYTFNPFR